MMHAPSQPRQARNPYPFRRQLALVTLAALPLLTPALAASVRAQSNVPENRQGGDPWAGLRLAGDAPPAEPAVTRAPARAASPAALPVAAPLPPRRPAIPPVARPTTTPNPVPVPPVPAPPAPAVTMPAPAAAARIAGPAPLPPVRPAATPAGAVPEPPPATTVAALSSPDPTEVAKTPLAYADAPTEPPPPVQRAGSHDAKSADTTNAGADLKAAEPATAEPPPPAPPANDGVHEEAAVPASASPHEAQGSAKPEPVQATHAAPVSAPPAGPAATPLKPAELVRRLQRLQDRIAGGDVDGIATQRTLISEIDRAFASADATVWQDPANARALVIYVLSGGTPAVLRDIVTREPKPAIDEKLLLGALLYVEGREEPALRELGEVDARKLPNALGGQIALAQAALVVRKDPQKATQLLDLSRLLLPGTLVEEAALRRQILVAAQANDTDTFARLSGQYLFRFRHSAYAGNFRQRFASALTRMAFIAAPDGLDRLDQLLRPMEEDGQRDIYLLIARAALVEGKTALAANAARRALALSPPASRDAERAQVYLGAAEAVTADQYQAAAKTLQAIDRDRLDPSDVALVEAALSAADMVRQADQPAVAAKAPASPPAAPQPPAAAAPAAASGRAQPVPQTAQAQRAPAVAPSPPTDAAKGTSADDGKPSAAVLRAQDSLNKIDALLKDAPR